jgi:type IV pilus assembly protein PilW
MLQKDEGLTLIELLIALAVGAILMAGLYRTLTGQHKTYTAQEQVVDTQQNVRAAIERMTTEIRMAGYRKDILASMGNIGGFTKVITPGNNAGNIGTNDDQITVIIADKAITYRLQWDTGNPSVPVLVRVENGVSEVLADNIEALQIRYTLKDGTVTDSPGNPDTIRMVSVGLTARTKMGDPQLGGDGFRRRDLSSLIVVRNMGV